MKKVLLILICILLSGCSKKTKIENNVITIIDEHKNYYSSINYPTTKIKELDSKIEKYVNDLKTEFNTNYKIISLNQNSELNIDYTYKLDNRNINIKIESYFSNSILNSPIKKSKIFTHKIKNEITMNSEEYIETINYKNFVDPNKPVIAFTFDDGPSSYTNSIIELFKVNGGNATFFILGNKVNIYKNLLTKSLKLGNELGNHSYNHKWLSRLSNEEIKFQIEETQRLIKEATNYTPLYLRPTYGAINDKIRNASNLEIVFWTVDSNDWKIKDKSKIAERVLNSVSDGKIVLMHDIHKRTLDALKIIIPKLKEEGYQFVTISELKEVEYLRKKSNG